MEDGPEYAEKWDIPDERWKELTQQISSRSEVSFALDIVVSEFWSANTHFESMIKKLPSVEEEETR